MNFGSAYALHDSDDEDERVIEDAPPSGPLSSMGEVLFGAGPALTRAFAGSPPAPQPPAGTSMPNSIRLGGGLGIPHDALVPAAAPPAAAAAARARAGAEGAGGAGVPLWPPPPVKAGAGVPASRLPVDFGASIGGDDGASGERAKAKEACRRRRETPKYDAGRGSAGARSPQTPAPPPSRTWTRKVR
ncbi:unnamed protein product [Ectocarpus sp. CCAP 1310/34]|nr:unnamed protein product [Ectocarpus sp. CCAP 1310/34]